MKVCIVVAGAALAVTVPLNGKDKDRAVRSSPAQLCEAVLSAASACAAESVCNADTPAMLSGADRGALVAMERVRGFSGPAFDRYCLKACTSRSSEIDVDAFSHDVCGLDADGSPLEDRRRGKRR